MSNHLPVLSVTISDVPDIYLSAVTNQNDLSLLDNTLT